MNARENHMVVGNADHGCIADPHAMTDDEKEMFISERETFATMVNDDWLVPLADCFGLPLRQAIQGLETLYGAALKGGQPSQVITAHLCVREILHTLSRLEKDAKDQVEEA